MRRLSLLVCLAFFAMLPILHGQEVISFPTSPGKCGFLGVYPTNYGSVGIGVTPDGNGALLTGIVPNTGAARAGLQAHDVIVEFNGTKITNAMQLHDLVLNTTPGSTAKITLVRGDVTMDVNAEITKRTDLGVCACNCNDNKANLSESQMQDLQQQMLVAEKQLRDAEKQLRETLKESGTTGFVTLNSDGRFGMALQNLTPQLARYFGLENRAGALISDIRDGSPSAAAGLQAGDVIVAIDGQKVNGPADVVRMIGGKQQGTVELRVIRDRQEQTITVRLGGGTSAPPAPQTPQKKGAQENPDLGCLRGPERPLDRNLIYNISLSPLGLAK